MVYESMPLNKSGFAHCVVLSELSRVSIGFYGLKCDP